MGKRLLLVLLPGLALAAACAQGREPAVRQAAVTVRVELDEFAVVADPDSVSPGQVRFLVTNNGRIDHNFRVIETDLAAGKLPVAAAGVDEEGSGISVIAKISEVGPDDTKTVTADLEAGSYVLICNVPGHYQSGMRVVLQVR